MGNTIGVSGHSVSASLWASSIESKTLFCAHCPAGPTSFRTLAGNSSLSPSPSPFSEAGESKHPTKTRLQFFLAAAPSAVSLQPEPTAERGDCWSPVLQRIPVPGGWISTPIEPHYAMSNPTSVARTAPIAIAARKPQYLEPSVETLLNGNGRDSIRSQLSASMSSTTSAESGTNIRSRKDRPCDACRRRKSRCVIHEGQTSCVLCQFHTQECTFVQSPQPRKRKLNTENKEESVAKRRYA